MYVYASRLVYCTTVTSLQLPAFIKIMYVLLYVLNGSFGNFSEASKGVQTICTRVNQFLEFFIEEKQTYSHIEIGNKAKSKYQFHKATNTKSTMIVDRINRELRHEETLVLNN